jgi:hypothetical protein
MEHMRVIANEMEAHGRRIKRLEGLAGELSV